MYLNPAITTVSSPARRLGNMHALRFRCRMRFRSAALAFWIAACFLSSTARSRSFSSCFSSSRLSRFLSSAALRSFAHLACSFLKAATRPTNSGRQAEFAAGADPSPNSLYCWYSRPGFFADSFGDDREMNFKIDTPASGRQSSISSLSTCTFSEGMKSHPASGGAAFSRKVFTTSWSHRWLFVISLLTFWKKVSVRSFATPQIMPMLTFWFGLPHWDSFVK